MKFGIFYELQSPKPWAEDDDHRLLHEALEQVELADRLGIDHAWAVEHHFLDEYSHCSAPEVFLAGCAARTKNIRIGHGVRHVIPNYNHPARVAEGIATLDLLSHGRVEFGFGEGATRLELAGFNIPAKEKRALAIEAVGQIAEMMTMSPYPGYSSPSFQMPCRNVLPKPLQKPHPPLWMACTNRETIRVAASLGVGALAFSFQEPGEAQHWVKAYYDTICSDQCVPIGRSVNANIAMVSAFSVHPDRQEAVRRGELHFQFFGYAIGALVTQNWIPGRTNVWSKYLTSRGLESEHQLADVPSSAVAGASAGIGTPEDVVSHLKDMQDAGVDQIILMQQAGRSKHDHTCESLELFASDVLPEFAEVRAKREAEKAERLAPFIEAALARRKTRPEMKTEDIPVVEASR